MSDFINLFFVFFKIGLFTFGGGYAMLPLLQDEIVKKRKWATDEEMLDYYSIGQCTPGIIAINVATFIGYKKRGVLGGIFATFGMILPSLIIIMLVASTLNKYMDNAYLQKAFSGIRVAVTALIADILWNLFPKSVKSKFTFIVFVSCLALIFVFKFSAVMVVLFTALLGFFKWYFLEGRTK